VVVQQGEQEGFRPTLYVLPAEEADPGAFEAAVREAVATVEKDYPGLAVAPATTGWRIVVPEEYQVGHEAHFSQVTKQYLEYLVAGEVPAVEVQRMLAKYFVTTRAYQLSRPAPR
jgi:hypothetical protein